MKEKRRLRSGRPAEEPKYKYFIWWGHPSGSLLRPSSWARRAFATQPQRYTASRHENKINNLLFPSACLRSPIL